MLISARVYEYDSETMNYLQRILSNMRCNHTTCSDLYTVPSNKRAGE